MSFHGALTVGATPAVAYTACMSAMRWVVLVVWAVAVGLGCTQQRGRDADTPAGDGVPAPVPDAMGPDMMRPDPGPVPGPPAPQAPPSRPVGFEPPTDDLAPGPDASTPTPATPDAGPAMAGPTRDLDPASVLFADDFELGAVGAAPPGWGTFVAWVHNGANPSGDASALVDDAHSHGGQRAAHFHGGSNPAQLVRPLPTGTDHVYVRAYVRASRQLGQHPGANHETLIAIRDAAGAAHAEVRFGEIKGVIGTNEVPSDNLAPRMDRWGQGPVMPAETWACVEVAFLGDRSPNELHAWIDGQEVHAVTQPGQDFQNGPLPDDWLADHFGAVVIGWHSFSNATADVWMDDVVVARERVHCE